MVGYKAQEMDYYSDIVTKALDAFDIIDILDAFEITETDVLSAVEATFGPRDLLDAVIDADLIRIDDLEGYLKDEGIIDDEEDEDEEEYDES